MHRPDIRHIKDPKKKNTGTADIFHQQIQKKKDVWLNETDQNNPTEKRKAS